MDIDSEAYVNTYVADILFGNKPIFGPSIVF